ncbi:dienelactone hydrolase family protein [Nocardioides marmotae]|uniref:Dienelactone hydrolase n=1 Tax=Nocardioides marmotae TaxID=2663857 RepID=A0A6I3JFM1_9ACTN|nr:dienelactone hydrolase family protein [Nocardioides marmotae]MCR6033210.1 dienelactone hydrolase [Gordonia jinghuaiqii]MBC9732716.1 dienelactone hydrolase family protein [Nocardioides marmotae]MTB83833.1 dienelactone hydrolase [Nocardioides marmotae]MTB96865.1 dienelactone hydrolase [Nocardioides marmotae]QKE02943.1 dienelactone hydrolase [Nocardioides marmotae]
MADLVLFHHALGLTDGVRAFADRIRAAGHTVETPDLFDGARFETIEAGVAHAQEVGFATVLDRARAAVDGLPEGLVYAGFSLGVLPAQQLAQTRPGARGAVLMESFVPPSEFGSWPAGVPAQVHGMDADPFFAQEGDLDAAREFAGSGVAEVELFTYPGDVHLFADSGLPGYDQDAAGLVADRVLEFLDRLH